MDIKRGFTLIEMIVVLTIFILLLGLSSAVYLSFRKEMTARGAATQVLGMIQTAHNSALISRQRTYIVEKNMYQGADFVRSDIISFGQQSVGMWHLDDEDHINDDGVSWGYGGNLNVSGTTLVTGRIGSGLDIDGGSLSCANTRGDFTPEDGIAGSMWVKFNRPTEEDVTVDNCTLMQLGSVYKFYVEGGQLGLQIGDNTLLSTTKEDENYFLLPEKWLHLSFSYDTYTRQMAIFVNKAEKGSLVFGEDYFLPYDEGDLVIATGLYGTIDEISLRGVMESATFELPDGLGMNIPKEAVGTVPYIRSYEEEEYTTYLKITAFDEKGWITGNQQTSATIGFYNHAYPQRDEYRRVFKINKQGLVEVQ